MNDALEVLNDLEEWLKGFDNGPYPTELQSWIDNKRLEFLEPQGDCCG